MEEIANKNTHNTVLKSIQFIPTKILDIGCGHGLFLKRIHEKYPECELYGCDINQPIYDKIRFTHHDLNTELPYDNESFSTITCIEVIEHLENPFMLLREIHRVLKKDGELVISTPNIENIFSRIMFVCYGRFIHFYTDNDVSKMNHNHITPIFDWKLKEAIIDRFIIVDTKYNVSQIPYLHIPLYNCRAFADSKVIKMIKI